MFSATHIGGSLPAACFFNGEASAVPYSYCEHRLPQARKTLEALNLLRS
jgi:hypothetical protein